DRIHEPVITLERDDPGDAEERSGTHIIPGDCESVLPGGYLAVRGKEGIRPARAARRPIGNHQRDADKDQEDQEGHRHRFSSEKGQIPDFRVRSPAFMRKLVSNWFGSYELPHDAGQRTRKYLLISSF